MNHIPDRCDDAAYPGTMCPKFAASRQHEKFPANQTFDGEYGSGLGTETRSAPIQNAPKSPGRKIGIILL
jgi:hypothetical protein